jgi:adenosylhomocysteine nucleosidase
MIAILVAVRQELKPILRRADANHVVRQEHLDFHEGRLGGKPVALLALGIGKECARIAAEMTIRCYRPDLVISSGFGGGLQSDIRAGDIVIGTEILELGRDQGDQITWTTAHKPVRPDRIRWEDNSGIRVHYGKILTTDEMVLRASNKARIGRATGALAVDMETSAVAAVCAARKTDFLAVRGITDLVHEDLPDEFNDFFVLGQLRPDRVFSSCVRDPRVLADLARLGYRARHSGAKLARFLEAAIAQLHLPAFAARDFQ